jgi:hypothetical protein
MDRTSWNALMLAAFDMNAASYFHITNAHPEAPSAAAVDRICAGVIRQLPP